MFTIINQLKQLSTFSSNHNYSLSHYSYSTLRLWTFGLIFSFFIFNIQSCGLDVEDPTLPLPPQWVEKSLPEKWPERGIDAHETNGIFLEWHAISDVSIRYVDIYRSVFDEFNNEVGEFFLLRRIDRSLNIESSYIDNDLIPWTTYFYKLRAIDETGNRSEVSDSLNYRLMLPVTPNSLRPNGMNEKLSEDRRIWWRTPGNVLIETEEYTLTILTLDKSLIYRSVITPSNYVGEESWTIPDTILLLSGARYQWRIDAGGMFDEGLEHSGSESNWATFLFYNG
jgi:hypothetical protein